MRLLTIVSTVLLVAALAGCDDNPCSTVCDADDHHSIIIFDAFDDITLYTDPLIIKEIGLGGNILYLKVEYGGGCRDHDFELYGMSSFLESDPPQASVYLSHNANGDACDALIISELEFSLVPLKEEFLKAYDDGPMLLRIFGPGATDPVRPLILYVF